MLMEGKSAPDFKLVTDSGRVVSRAALKGRPVVLYFYPKDDTPGCTEEARSFSCLLKEFEDAGAVVMGVSPDSVDSHRKFKSAHGIGVELAADETRKTCEAYGVWGEKTMFGRKFMGVVRSTFLIDAAGRLARIWRNVRVPGHAEEVLEAVRALGR